jgi:hypothetical protein
VGVKDIYLCEFCVFFFAVALQPNSGPGLLIVEVSRAHTIRHTCPVVILSTGDQLVVDATTDTTYKAQGTNIHTLSGIRTGDPSNRATADRSAAAIDLCELNMLMGMGIFNVESS